MDRIDEVVTDDIPLGDRIEYLEFLREMINIKRVQFNREHKQLIKELSEVKNSPLGYPDPLSASRLVLLLAHVVWKGLRNANYDVSYYITDVVEGRIVGILK